MHRLTDTANEFDTQSFLTFFPINFTSKSNKYSPSFIQWTKTYCLVLVYPLISELYTAAAGFNNCSTFRTISCLKKKRRKSLLTYTLHQEYIRSESTTAIQDLNQAMPVQTKPCLSLWHRIQMPHLGFKTSWLKLLQFYWMCKKLKKLTISA